jgi:hypothetical protein
VTAALLALLHRLWPWLLGGLALLFVWATIDGAIDAGKAREAVRAKGAAEIARGQEKASSAAAGAVADLSERNEAREAETRETRDAILSTENAGDDAGDAGRVGCERLCRRPLYRDRPDCVRLCVQGSAPGSR